MGLFDYCLNWLWDYLGIILIGCETIWLLSWLAVGLFEYIILIGCGTIWVLFWLVVGLFDYCRTPLEGEVSENWVGISFRQELVDEVTSNEIDGKAAGQKKIYSNLQKAILYYHCNRRRQGGSIGCCWWLGGWNFLWENNGKQWENNTMVR